MGTEDRRTVLGEMGGSPPTAHKQSKERKEVGKLDPNEYIPEFRVLKKGSTLGP